MPGEVEHAMAALPLIWLPTQSTLMSSWRKSLGCFKNGLDAAGLHLIVEIRW